MAGAVKGVTIEFSANAKKLDDAIKNIKKESKATAKELREIDKAIKFNPTSIDAWRQKQTVLKKAIEETSQKLTLMKQRLKEMSAQGLNAENSEEFRRMQREIDQTERHLKSLEGELKAVGNVKLRAASEQFKQWGTQLENAGQKMRGLSMAAGAVAASIGALTVKSGQWADDLNTMSKRYGIATGDLQKYSAAADLVDVSTESIAKSQTRLKKSMLSAQDGSGATAEAFQKLGIEVTNADGSLRDGDAVFQDTIAALGSMSNETERDALAMQLMGRSANELNPLIEDGGETYKRVADTMKKYGLDFIDQETLDKANEFNDTLDMIKMIGLVTFQSLGTELAGYLAPAMEKVVDVVGRVAEWLGNLSPETLAVIASIAGVVAVLAPLLIGLGKVAFAISNIINVVNMVSGALGALGGGAILPIVAVIGVLVAAFKHLWDTNAEFRAKMTAIWNFVKATVVKFVAEASAKIQELIAIFTGGSGSIKDAWEAFCNFLAPMFEGAFTIIATVVQTVLNVILGILDVFIAVFKGDWGAAWEAVKGIFASIWNGLVGVFTAVWGMLVNVVKLQIAVIKAVITTVFNVIKSFIQTVWNAIKDVISRAIDSAKTKVQNVVNSIRNTVTSVFNTLKSTVSSIWNGIKSAITKPLESAKNTVSKIVDKIKSFFPLKLGKLLNFKLPRITIGTKSKSVGGKTVKVPDFDLSWYAKGGIFDSPSIIGVGEAGQEAVVPLDKFWDTLESNNKRTDSILQAQTRILVAMLDELQKDKDFKIDGRVAGRIINDLVRV